MANEWLASDSDGGMIGLVRKKQKRDFENADDGTWQYNSRPLPEWDG